MPLFWESSAAEVMLRVLEKGVGVKADITGSQGRGNQTLVLILRSGFLIKAQSFRLKCAGGIQDDVICYLGLNLNAKPPSVLRLLGITAPVPAESKTYSGVSTPISAGKGAAAQGKSATPLAIQQPVQVRKHFFMVFHFILKFSTLRVNKSVSVPLHFIKKKELISRNFFSHF